jgi:hypothetical protein
MISELKPKGVEVLSLTTIATPHHGSAFADYLFQRIGATNIPRLYKALEFFGFETGAFEQLTNKYMTESFNPRTPDSPDVRYFSYGAQLNPHLTSVLCRLLKERTMVWSVWSRRSGVSTRARSTMSAIWISSTGRTA